MSGITNITELALSKFFQDHRVEKKYADVAAKTLVEAKERGDLEETLTWVRDELERKARP